MEDQITEHCSVEDDRGECQCDGPQPDPMAPKRMPLPAEAALSLPCLPPSLALSSPAARLQSSPTPAVVPTLSKAHTQFLSSLTKQTHLQPNCRSFSKRPHLETSPPQSNYPSSPATCPYVAALLIYMLILLSLLQRGELFVKNLTLQPEFRPSHYLPANLGRYG